MDPRLQRSETLHVQTGFACQNDCVFCCDGGFGHFGASMSDAALRQILAVNRHRDTVEFTEHEPTLNPALTRWVSMARDEGYATISVVTNGRRLGRGALLSRLVDAGLTRVQISVHAPEARLHDATTQRRGSFAQTIAGVERVCRLRERLAQRGQRLALHLHSTITARNVEVLPELLAFVRGFAPDLHGLNGVFLIGRARAHAARVALPYHRIVSALGRALPLPPAPRVVLSEVPPCQTVGRLPPELVGLREEFHLAAVGSDERPLQGGLATAPGRGFSFGPRCAPCVLRERCDGVAEAYIERFGWKAFQPVSEAQLEGAHFGDEGEIRRLLRAKKGAWKIIGVERHFHSARVHVEAASADLSVTIVLSERDPSRPAYRRTARFNVGLEGQRHEPAQLLLADLLCVQLRRAERRGPPVGR